MEQFHQTKNDFIDGFNSFKDNILDTTQKSI